MTSDTSTSTEVEVDEITTGLLSILEELFNVRITLTLALQAIRELMRGHGLILETNGERHVRDLLEAHAIAPTDVRALSRARQIKTRFRASLPSGRRSA